MPLLPQSSVTEDGDTDPTILKEQLFLKYFTFFARILKRYEQVFWLLYGPKNNLCFGFYTVPKITCVLASIRSQKKDCVFRKCYDSEFWVFFFFFWSFFQLYSPPPLLIFQFCMLEWWDAVLQKQLAWALFVLLLSTLVLSANRVDLGFFPINFPVLHLPLHLPFTTARCRDHPETVSSHLGDAAIAALANMLHANVDAGLQHIVTMAYGGGENMYLTRPHHHAYKRWCGRVRYSLLRYMDYSTVLIRPIICLTTHCTS